MIRHLLLPILLSLSIVLTSATIHGIIESCSGCSLNRLPILKAFLKDGTGADAYKNVEVVFIHGRQAVLTIYDVPDDMVEGGEREDGKAGMGWIEREKVVLSDYKTMDEMHALMVEKGFELKSESEREAIRLQRERERAREEQERLAQAARRNERNKKKAEEARKKKEGERQREKFGAFAREGETRDARIKRDELFHGEHAMKEERYRARVARRNDEMRRRMEEEMKEEEREVMDKMKRGGEL